MGIYLRLFFRGVFSKAFWVARIGTFREMISHPADYFSNLNSKDKIADAYLLGMASTFITWVALAAVYIFTFGLLNNFGSGLLFLPVILVVEFVCWIIGQYLLYHLGAWAFAITLKWLTGKYEIEKIRPILFSVGIAGIASIVPGFGSLLSFVVFIVFLVIAYENALKVERGPAVGSAVLGTLLLVVAMGLPFWLIGFLLTVLWSGTISLGLLGLMASLFHHAPSYDALPEKETTAIISFPTPTPATTGVAVQPIVATPTPAQAATPSPETQLAPQPVSKPAAKKKKPKKHSTSPAATEGQDENNRVHSSTSSDVSQPVPASEPQPTPTKGEDAVGKAVGDAAGEAAKKILGF